MLSVQQLVKALRKLPNISTAGASNTCCAAGDLLKSLKQMAIVGNSPIEVSTTAASDTTRTSSTRLTSQAERTDNNVTSSATEAEAAAAVNVDDDYTQKQQVSDQAQLEQHQIKASNSSQKNCCCESSSGAYDELTSRRNTYSCVNADGSLSTAVANGAEVLNSTVTKTHTTRGAAKTQALAELVVGEGEAEGKVRNRSTGTALLLNAATAGVVTGEFSSPSSIYLQRSQQIQKFYKQQLHYFHTQQQQQQPTSLCSKQKQTQFAMSSLAAEPLVLKQEDLLNGGGASKTSAASHGTATAGNCCENGGAAAAASSATSASASSSSSSSSAATSKPCFNTGLGEILQFMELIGNLKHTKRTGWVLRDVNDCESISGHMYRMSMMTFLLDGSEGLNQIRCMELALVHDLAESLVGDITPFCGITKTDKRAMEFKAMDDICKLIEPRGKRIMELFEEYEQGESAESKFVKDLDRLDMVMQAFEYEKRDNCLLKHQEFFDSTEGKFNHPFVKKLVNEIYEQRQTLAKAKGATPPPPVLVPSMEETTTNGHCVEQQKNSSTSS